MERASEHVPVRHQRVTSRGSRFDHGDAEELVKSGRDDDVGTLQDLEIIGSTLQRTEMNDPRPKSFFGFGKNFRNIFKRLSKNRDFKIELSFFFETEENPEKCFGIFIVLPTVRPDYVQPRIFPALK